MRVGSELDYSTNRLHRTMAVYYTLLFQSVNAGDQFHSLLPIRAEYNESSAFLGTP